MSWKKIENKTNVENITEATREKICDKYFTLEKEEGFSQSREITYSSKKVSFNLTPKF